MTSESGSAQHTRESIVQQLLAILDDVTGDWDLQLDGGIVDGTRLIADLGFESVDVVQLIVAIEEHFARRDMPFQELLMRDGQYVDELTVGEVADFLTQHLQDQ